MGNGVLCGIHYDITHLCMGIDINTSWYLWGDETIKNRIWDKEKAEDLTND